MLPMVRISHFSGATAPGVRSWDPLVPKAMREQCVGRGR